MGASEKVLEWMNTPEGKKKKEEWLKNFIEKEKIKTEKIKNMMSSTNYIEWLCQFAQKNEGGFCDDDWLYAPEELEKSDRDSVNNLCLFYEGIDEYAKRIHFKLTPCEFGNYYMLRYNEVDIKIGIFVGQGTVFFCDMTPVENTEAFIDFKDVIESFSKEKSTPKTKTKVFYAVATYSELGHQDIKAYCRTKEIAKRELKKYTDEWHSKPPKPDDKHILKLDMIVE